MKVLIKWLSSVKPHRCAVSATASPLVRSHADINEDGIVNVNDLGCVKANLSKKS